MAKTTIRYICQNCGAESLRWMGKCSSCGEWNTLVEETLTKQEKYKGGWVQRSTPRRLAEISTADQPRFSTGSQELDRVLGGGLVPGCLGLIGGDPGIGKSTLLLQVAGSVAEQFGPVLYATGEESLTQLKLRAERLGITAHDLTVVSESSTEQICSLIQENRPKLVIVDSIQTMFVDEVPSPPGSVGQVRESTGRFLQAAKGTNTSILLVGHVTKGGSLAGPKVLEHAVDFVLYFEGETHTSFRIIRSVKNRFGSTHEVGIYEMTDKGLREVSNPSQMLLAQRPLSSSGSVVVPCLEGTRPLLVEVQALVAPAHFGGPPRRQTTGVDYQRFSIILAVLEKRCGFALQNQDVFVNVAGGIRLEEPAVDLGIAVAVASSDLNRSIDPYCAVIGEIGLSGEIRAVRGIGQRLQELARLGFKKCIIPRANATGSEPLEVVGVSTIQEALAETIGSRR